MAILIVFIKFEPHKNFTLDLQNILFIDISYLNILKKDI